MESKLLDLKRVILKLHNSSDFIKNKTIAMYMIMCFWKLLSDKETKDYIGDTELLPDMLRLYAGQLVYQQFISDPAFRSWIGGIK